MWKSPGLARGQVCQDGERSRQGGEGGEGERGRGGEGKGRDATCVCVLCGTPDDSSAPACVNCAGPGSVGELERNMKGDEPIRMWLNEEALGFITPSLSISTLLSLSLALSFFSFSENNKEQGNYHRFLNEKEAGFESSCVCVCMCENVCVCVCVCVDVFALN